MKTTAVRITGALLAVAIAAHATTAFADDAVSGATPRVPRPPRGPVREHPAAARSGPPAPPEFTWWFAGGLGGGGIGESGAMFARAEVAVGHGRQLLSLSYGYAEDTNGSCDQILCLGNDVALPRNSAHELALRYGVRGRAPFVLGTAAIGVAALWGVNRGHTLLSQDCFWGCVDQYDHTSFRTVGATAEVGGYLSSRYFSIGPTFIADVNPMQSFWAVLLDLHFGYVGSP